MMKILTNMLDAIWERQVEMPAAADAKNAKGTKKRKEVSAGLRLRLLHRWIKMDAIAGRCVGEPVVMEYDWHAGRFYEDGELSRSEEADQIEAALAEAADDEN